MSTERNFLTLDIFNDFSSYSALRETESKKLKKIFENEKKSVDNAKVM